MTGPRLVSTGEAARAIGVHRRTLSRWVAAGLVQPDGLTAGGHMRWDVERLRAEIRRLLADGRDMADGEADDE